MTAALAIVGLVTLHLLWAGTLLAGGVSWLLKRGWPVSLAGRGRLVAGGLALLPIGAAVLAWNLSRGMLGPETTIMVSPEHAAGGALALDLLGSLVPWLGGIAAGASAIGLLGFVVSLARIESLRRRSGKPSAEWIQSLREAGAGASVPSSLRLRAAPVRMPTLIGCFRPTLLVPADHGDEWLDPEDRDHLLAHELAHAARRDGITLHFIALLRAGLAVVPAVHWLARLAEAEREAACDAAVIGRGRSARRYSRSLLRLATRAAGGPALAMPALGGSLADRVERLLRPPAAVPSPGLPMVAVLLVIVAPGTSAPLWLPPTRTILAAAVVPDRVAISASDAAGTFAVEFHRGRPVAACADGLPLPPPTVAGRLLVLRTDAGAPIVTLTLERRAFRWEGRPASARLRHPASE